MAIIIATHTILTYYSIFMSFEALDNIFKEQFLLNFKVNKICLSFYKSTTIEFLNPILRIVLLD